VGVLDGFPLYEGVVLGVGEALPSHLYVAVGVLEGLPLYEGVLVAELLGVVVGEGVADALGAVKSEGIIVFDFTVLPNAKPRLNKIPFKNFLFSILVFSFSF